jgi:hypothetical protein
MIMWPPKGRNGSLSAQSLANSSAERYWKHIALRVEGSRHALYRGAYPVRRRLEFLSKALYHIESNHHRVCCTNNVG